MITFKSGIIDEKRKFPQCEVRVNRSVAIIKLSVFLHYNSNHVM